jgi:hypothetical protein
LRDIAGQFQTSKSSIDRHQRCIAAQLKAFKASRAVQLNESLLERLERYREIAESPLDDADKELRLKALDRCYKQVDIEAKLTGAYQEKRSNEHDKQREREILVERWLNIYQRMSYDEASAGLRRIFEAKTEAEKRAMICEEMDEAIRLTSEPSGWREAEQIVQSRYAGN